MLQEDGVLDLLGVSIWNGEERHDLGGSISVSGKSSGVCSGEMKAIPI
jgi:hypothetical protein